jgi:nucleoside-diphosphate-sugar epimerase
MPTVLLLGATGRTGGRLLLQLLDRGAMVRAVVRSPDRLPAKAQGHPRLALTEASLLDLPDAELRHLVAGCDAVLSCLGHTLSLRGLLGPPHDLVTRAVVRTCDAIEALRPTAPVRFVLMSSVSVHRPRPEDSRRRTGERAFLWLLRALLPPARDNQRAADHLLHVVGARNPSVEWVVVRPDTLLEGEVSRYAVHDSLVDGIFRPGRTTMANVAHFMCELATGAAAWPRWRGGMPVIVDEVAGPG